MIRANRANTLEEVRRLKAECNREVAHLPLKDALEQRLRDSARAAAELGFVPDKERKAHALVAAEPAAEYRVKRQTKLRKDS